jgi:hypothetical protein
MTPDFHQGFVQGFPGGLNDSGYHLFAPSYIMIFPLEIVDTPKRVGHTHSGGGQHGANRTSASQEFKREAVKLMTESGIRPSMPPRSDRASQYAYLVICVLAYAT